MAVLGIKDPDPNTVLIEAPQYSKIGRPVFQLRLRGVVEAWGCRGGPLGPRGSRYIIVNG